MTRHGTIEASLTLEDGVSRSPAVATLTWTTVGVDSVEIRVGAADGKLFGRFGPSGTTTTGRWVTEGMTFFLQDISQGQAPAPENTLARVSVSLLEQQDALEDVVTDNAAHCERRSSVLPLSPDRRLNIRVVLRSDQLDWILGKMARQLVGALAQHADVSLGPRPDVSADLNHFVYYDDFRHGPGHSTVGITHIDSRDKFALVSGQLTRALAGICLSSTHMTELVHAGIPKSKLCYVTPAHDGVIAAKRVHVGITTRLYIPDPCKRWWLLDDLANHIEPADFSFTIMGDGWNDTVRNLTNRGFQVSYFPEFDLERYRLLIPTLDYYLYLGWDEGSMGFLDALHAGVKTIATSQGFHLDVEGGLTHGFDDLDSLVSIFARIAEDKNARRHAVSSLTWSNYARKHLDIWHYLLLGHDRRGPDAERDGLTSLLDPGPPRDTARGLAFLADVDRIDRERADLERAHQRT